MPDTSSKNLEYRFTGDDSSFEAAAKRVLNRFLQLQNLGTRFTSSLKNMSSRATTASRSLNSASNQAKKLTTNMKSAFSATSLLGSSIRTLTGAGLSKLFSDAIANSIDYVENLNAFNVAMGDSRLEAERYINTMSELLGLDPGDLMRQSAQFKNLANSMQIPEEAAQKLTTQFLELGNDLASLWNTSVDQAWNALRSAMVGLSRPLRQYGIDVTQTALEQTALSLGIDDTVASMSRANKIGLTYITIMRSATSSMGDFARTIESPANQLRILQQQFKALSRAVGDFFLGAIGSVLPYLNGIIMALTAILRFFASLMGIKVGDFGAAIGSASGGIGDITSGVEGVGDAADATSKKLKNMVAPFDELNIIQEPASTGGSGGIGGGGVGGIDSSILDAMMEYDNLMERVQMKAIKIRDRLMEILGFTKHINEETGEITWTWNFKDMLKGLKSAWDDIFTWWKGLDPGGKLIAALIGGFAIKKVAGVISKLMGILNSKFLTPFIALVGKFAKWGYKIFQTFNSSFVGPVGPIASAMRKILSAVKGMAGGSSAALGGIIAVVALVIAAIVDLWKNNEEFREKITQSWETMKNAIGDICNVLWVNILQPLWEAIKASVSALVPVFKWVLDTIWNLVQWCFNNVKNFVGTIIEAVMGILSGLTEFIAGVFTGDWKRAFNGLKQIVLSIFEGIANTVINAVNSVIDAVNWVISQVNRIKITTPSWWPIGGGRTYGLNIPSISTLGPVNFTGYARGGFLGSGEIFRAGENGNLEMFGQHQGRSTVMPLEDTNFVSAMGDAVRQGVIEAMQLQGSNNNNNNTPIQVIIGGKQFDTIVYKAYNRAQRSRGAALLGGALYANT